MTSRNRRIAIYIILSILLFLELTILDRIRLFGVRPDLLLIATVFFGFHFGVMRGLEIGLASGILKGIFSINDFGLSAFSFLFIGCLAGYFSEKLTRDNFLIQSLLTLLCTFVVSSIHLLYLSVDIGGQLWTAALYKGLYTGLLAPFIFFVLTRIFEYRKLKTEN